MILWILVALSFLSSIGIFFTWERNQLVIRETRKAMRRLGHNALPMAIIMGLSTFAICVMWLAYGIQQEDWRFIVIPWMPVIAGWLAKAASHTVPPESGHEEP